MTDGIEGREETNRERFLRELDEMLAQVPERYRRHVLEAYQKGVCDTIDIYSACSFFGPLVRQQVVGDFVVALYQKIEEMKKE